MDGLTVKITLKRENRAFPWELTKDSIHDLKMLGLELKTRDDEDAEEAPQTKA